MTDTQPDPTGELPKISAKGAPRVEVLPIERGATPDPSNVNQHTQRGGGLLENSLRKRGAFRSIASAGKGVEVPTVYAGNYTLEKAVSAGFTEIVNVHVTGNQLVNVVRDDIAPGSPEAVALGIEDNEIGKQSYNPDTDILAALAAGDSALLKALRDEDRIFDGLLDGMGVGADMSSGDAEPQIDNAEALRKAWGVEVGDVWVIGNHRLVCGDSTSADDIQKLLQGEKVTLLFADPPYGVNYEEKSRALDEFGRASKQRDLSKDIEADTMTEIDLGAMLLSAFTLAKTQLADDASVFVCSPQGGSLGMMMMMMMMMRDAGLEIRHVLNWVKNSPTFSLGRLDYEYQHEPILFTWNKTHKRYKRGFTTSTWAVDKPRSSKEHPTMKPVELPENAIINHTDIGDLVLDNFGGSGTTMVACQRTERQCRMMELTPGYCAVIIQRMFDAFPGISIQKQ